MQRSLTNQLSAQQAFAEKLQKTLRQTNIPSIPVMVQLTSDRITNQPINQLLRQPIVDTNAFFTTFIDLLQIYKKAHRNKLGKSHPKHKRVWQLIYGNRQQHRSMVKQLLKQPNYGFTIHWDHWKIVFDALNHQLQQQLPLLQTQKLSHTSLFASPAQHNVHETLSATSTPCPTTAHHQAPVPLQTTQLQTVSPLADASADENNQPTPTFIQRLRQFHQSHAVYFKFAKYLLIAVTIAIACIGTSVGIAVLLDLAFDLSATASVLSLVKEILIGVQTLVLLGAKELFQLAKKNVPQKLKDYHTQRSQAHLAQVDESLTTSNSLHSETTTACNQRFFHSAQYSNESSTVMNTDINTNHLRV